MRWKRFLIFLFAITIINASNLRDMVSISSLNIGPDILLIFLLYIAVGCNRSDTILASFLIGFAADVSSVAMVIGPYTVSYGLLGGLLSLFRRKVIGKRMVYQSIAIFMLAAIGGLLAEFLIFVKSGEIPPNVSDTVLLTAFYSAVVGPLIWKLFASSLRLPILRHHAYS